MQGVDRVIIMAEYGDQEGEAEERANAEYCLVMGIIVVSRKMRMWNRVLTRISTETLTWQLDSPGNAI